MRLEQSGRRQFGHVVSQDSRLTRLSCCFGGVTSVCELKSLPWSPAFAPCWCRVTGARSLLGVTRANRSFRTGVGPPICIWASSPEWSPLRCHEWDEGINSTPGWVVKASVRHRVVARLRAHLGLASSASHTSPHVERSVSEAKAIITSHELVLEPSSAGARRRRPGVRPCGKSCARAYAVSRSRRGLPAPWE